MRIGLLGAGEKGTRRAAALAGAAAVDSSVRVVGVADADPDVAHGLAASLGVSSFAQHADLLAAVDVACVAVATPDRFAVAAEAVAAGCHVFAEWPPASSLDEAERLARHAEEAGVEIGVARPLPTAALLASCPPGFAPRLVALDLVVGPGSDAGVRTVSWPHRLAGALDLCAALARSRDVLHLDGEAERGPGGTYRAVAFALRFRNGVYAHALLREGASARFSLHATGSGTAVEAHALSGPFFAPEALPPADRAVADPLTDDPAAGDPTAPSLALELADFLAAVGAGRAAPVSILDALRTMRLADRLLQRLR